MASFRSQLFLTVAVLVALIICVQGGGDKSKRESRVNEEGCTNNYSVDFLQLALIWGPGYCEKSKNCVSGVKPEFSIHGLWPQRYNSNSPTSCCARDKFSLNQLKHLKGSLKQDWPSLTNYNEDGSFFWEYQYKKHGRCADKIKGLDSAYGYFSFALQLFQKIINPKVALERKGIRPSFKQTYSGEQIVKVLSAAIGNKVTISCSESKKYGYNVLDHVHICVDLDFQRTRCPYVPKACLGEILYLPA